MRRGRGRDVARIDPAEDDPQAGRQDVRNSAGGILRAASRRAAHRAAWSEHDEAAAEAAPSPSEHTFSRGDLRLARVQPQLEEATQLLTADPDEAAWPARLQLDDPYLCVARAVAAEVALL